PLGALADVRETNGPFVLTRYNMYPAAFINGSGSAATSSRQAIDLMDEIALQSLPPSMATEWTEMAFLELLAGNTAMVVFGFAVIMVFLVLAAQYESWSLPLAVILVVPMCLLSAIAGVWIANMDINIFTQIGFVVLVGLASKNAILIVEFANQLRATGLTAIEAVQRAARTRLRPILMTSLAFVFGIFPLVIATGAGSNSRNSLGTALFGGMILSTILNLVVVPVLYILVEGLRERVHRSPTVHETVPTYTDETLAAASLAVTPDGTLVAVTHGDGGDRRAVRIATLGEHPRGE
ncbi:MAG: efflux RND transporter permease subunit, partial [Vulcanimicrobiaceae bacterium]